LYGVQKNSGIRADEDLRRLPYLLELNAPNRSISKDHILDDLAFVPHHIAFVDRNVSSLETNRHALAIFSYAESRRLLKTRFCRPQTGWNCFVEFAQVPNFELWNGFSGIVRLKFNYFSNLVIRLAR
jgi:hypothetical protein